jgi:hypothetical protein
MADVEDFYPITNLQGESIIVQMDDRDVVFTRRDKIYVANFLDTEYRSCHKHEVHTGVEETGS